MNQENQFQPMIGAVPFILDGARLLIKILSATESQPELSSNGAVVSAAAFLLPPVAALPHGTVSYMLPAVSAGSAKPAKKTSSGPGLEQFLAIEALASQVLSSKQMDDDQFIQLNVMAGIVISSLTRVASHAGAHEHLWLVDAALESAFQIANRVDGPYSQRALAFGQALWTSYVQQGKLAQADFLAQWSHSLVPLKPGADRKVARLN